MFIEQITIRFHICLFKIFLITSLKCPITMLRFQKLFGSSKNCPVIGMIHLDALPGTPRYKGSIEKIVAKACKETEVYLQNNLNGVMVENMHDVPYVQNKYFTPETTAVMTRVCTELRKMIPKEIPFGIQVLACGNKEAVAIAGACAMDFIRAEGFVFSHIADEGFTDANAGQILRYRRLIDADNVLVLADVKKKHSSHAITSDVSLGETAKAAEFFLADGLILTGTATGDPANLEELDILKKSTRLPVLIGSGVTADNVQHYQKADGLIIGSFFKKNGHWQEDVDAGRVSEFMKAAR